MHMQLVIKHLKKPDPRMVQDKKSRQAHGMLSSSLPAMQKIK